MTSEFDDDRFADSPEVMPPSYPPASRDAVGTEHGPDDEETKDVSKARRIWSTILEFFTVIAVALLISVVLKSFVIQAFEIPSESMEDTLIPGDRIVVNKLADDADDLHRGDIVVFLDPGGWLGNTVTEEDQPLWRDALQTVGEAVGLLPKNSGDHLVKRIIGMPGDRVESAGPGEPLMVNGVPVDESVYLKSGVEPSEQAFSVKVPAGYIWVMGDNRPRSKDSRFQQSVNGFGFVPIENIEGRAWLRIFPFDRFETLPSGTGVFADVPKSE